MGASKGSKIASLILRVLTLILLFISLIINASNSKTVLKGTENEMKAESKNVYSYRYLMAVAIIGGALCLLQIALSIYHLVTKGDGTPLFYFFSDKLLSYLLISAASAGLGAGIDLRVNFKLFLGDYFNSFFDKGNAASAILLLAFFCSAIVTVLSSLALIKKPA